MASLQQLGHKGGMRLDLESSFGNKKSEETVDDLIKKLNEKGTKVKIVSDDVAGDKENQLKLKKEKDENLEVINKEH